jgi:hypothetical protein
MKKIGLELIEKEDDLINLIDEFIFSTKKELRKK